MKDYELEHARKWGYSPRICFAKAMGHKCIEPNLTCDKCVWGNKTPQRFGKLKSYQSIKRK